MENLKSQAEALGIKVDGRWSDDRIRAEIAKLNSQETAMNEAEKAADAANLIDQAQTVESATEENIRKDKAAADAAAERRAQAPNGQEGEQAVKDLVKKAPKKAGGKAPVRLLYDTWDENEARVAAGSVVDMDIEDAKVLIRAGKAERADPMPGEE